MNRLSLSVSLCLVTLVCYAQTEQERTLDYYIGAAAEYSPLIKDYKVQSDIQKSELQRLKAVYTQSRLELNGDILFVPIVEVGNGTSSFRWNAQSAGDYYGYDLGESSGHLHAGITWSQPLLGNSSYRTELEKASVEEDVLNNRILMEIHGLERAVTEQYLLCLLDRTQVEYADSVNALLERQLEIVRSLVSLGMAKQSDISLLLIEQRQVVESRIASANSYRSHLTDLHLLCGIEEDEDVVLSDVELDVSSGMPDGNSLFMEQFRLDSLSAELALRSFNVQYKPRLDLFVNGGLQSGSYAGMYRHFGWSAGLTFSWIIADGGQKRMKEHQMQLQQNGIRTYKEHAEYQRKMRISQCLSEFDGYQERISACRSRLEQYDMVLSAYDKELRAGQISVLDYIMVLRNRIQAQRDHLLLQINRQLVVVAYNYWNW